MIFARRLLPQFAPQFTIQSLSRVLYNNSGRTAGQAIESDSYATITNAVYLATAPGSPYSGGKITNQLSGQAPNGNYYATYYGYDADGRQYQIIDANGTITDTVFDSLGRTVSIWVGTNDTVSGAAGTPTYFVGSNAGIGNNMTEVTSYVYDNGGVGDSNVTEVIQYPAGNTADTQQVDLLDYDFRDRLIATETGLTLNSSGSPVASSSDPYPLITVSSLDNLGGGSSEAVGAWETSGCVWPPCELAGRKEMNIVEIVRCSRHTLWRFCGVWYCDSLQCHKKTKIRSLAKHNVFAVLLTPPQRESQRTENPALSVSAPSRNRAGVPRKQNSSSNKAPANNVADAKPAKPPAVPCSPAQLSTSFGPSRNRAVPRKYKVG